MLSIKIYFTLKSYAKKSFKLKNYLLLSLSLSAYFLPRAKREVQLVNMDVVGSAGVIA
jgi:hypothetical protein